MEKTPEAPAAPTITDRAHALLAEVEARQIGTGVQSAALILAGLAVEALDRIGTQLARANVRTDALAIKADGIAASLETIAANIEQANRVGWGPG
mgnify:CR=1 FL=1